MKKKISLAVSLASVTMLSASVIEWELPNLTDGAGKNDLTVSAANIVFIADAAAPVDGIISGTPAEGGRNTIEDQDETYTAGTWTDSLTGPHTYYMAYKSGDTYYAISDGKGGVITAAVTGNEDPLLPSSQYSGNVSYSSFAPDKDGKIGTVAQSVPEPATAALAFAGLAMLLRRRRAV